MSSSSVVSEKCPGPIDATVVHIEISTANYQPVEHASQFFVRRAKHRLFVVAGDETKVVVKDSHVESLGRAKRTVKCATSY